MKFKKAVGAERYTIFATDRVKRPEQANISKSSGCPFCSNNIDKSQVVDYIGSSRYSWKVVSIKNKYPITDLAEVIVHSPDHSRSIELMSPGEMAEVYLMYQKRYVNLKDKGSVIIFCNYGKFAGASLEHPHSQIIVVDGSVKINQLPLQNFLPVVYTQGDFELVVPEYSEYPYEVWIVNKKKGLLNFERDDFLAAGTLTQKIISILITHLAEISLSKEHANKPHIHWKDYGVAYNYYLSIGDDFYVRIIPKLSIQAGFELATDINVNVVDPVEVVELLKQHLQ